MMAEDVIVDGGTVSTVVARGGNALTDATKNWAADVHRNRLVKITSGLGSGQLAIIDGNSGNTLRIRGRWPQAIGPGAIYVICGLDIAQILTDIFGAGSSIDIAQVLRDVFGAGTDIDLRANRDAFETTQYIHRQDKSLSDFFSSWPANLDDFWLPSGFTSITGEVRQAYSRKAFHYPVLSVRARWPAMAADAGEAFIGFESGSHGIASLAYLALSYTVFRFAAGLGNQAPGAIGILDVENLMPADYATAFHQYSIKINKCSVELYIDAVIKGIILLGLPEAIPEWENNDPYALGSSISPTMGMGVNTLIEVARPAGPITLVCVSNAEQFVALDGDPLPPRQYALYTVNTSTKWNGLATAGVVLTSHPVPVWGYEKKTLLFQADAAGNLDIQVYTGGAWRPWVPGGITLVANQLLVYNLNGEVPIARCIYTPTNADAITLAEWYLS